MIKNSFVVVAALASTAALAQGAFDFSRVPGLPAEPSVQIDLPAQLLGFVTEAVGPSDPGTAEVLAGLRGVRVLVYEDPQEGGALLETIEAASRMLENEGWQRMVYVNEVDEKVRIYIKLGDDDLAGMTVMVFDAGGEAVFVNVDGSIEPAMLGHLANSFGVGGVLDDLTGLATRVPRGAPAPRRER